MILIHRKESEHCKLEFSLFLIENNYEVTLISNFGEHRDYLNNMGLKTVQLNINRSKLNPVLDIVSMMKLIRVYKKIKPVYRYYLPRKCDIGNVHAVLEKFFLDKAGIKEEGKQYS